MVLIKMTLEINDKEQLNDLMKKIKRIGNVFDAYRVTV